MKRSETTADEVLTAIRAYRTAHGQLPTWAALNSGTVALGVSTRAIQRHFGRWNVAVSSAGHVPRLACRPKAPPDPLTFRCPRCLGTSPCPTCAHCGAEINAILTSELAHV